MIGRKLRRLYRQLLFVDKFRYWVCWLRYQYARKILHRLKVADATDADPKTIEYNMSGVLNMLDSRRSNILIRPLTLIESVNANSKILAIGPRTEGEILLLHAYGFEFENIRGLDLFSYSPWIDVGDMHNMPYPDSSFDVVISSMVITYSNNHKLAAAEMLRVVRPGGVIAINLTHVSKSEAESEPTIRSAEVRLRPQSVAQLLDLFDGHADFVYFQQDAYPDYRPESANMIKGDPGNIVSVIFRVSKPRKSKSGINEVRKG